MQVSKIRLSNADPTKFYITSAKSSMQLKTESECAPAPPSEPCPHSSNLTRPIHPSSLSSLPSASPPAQFGAGETTTASSNRLLHSLPPPRADRAAWVAALEEHTAFIASLVHEVPNARPETPGAPETPGQPSHGEFSPLSLADEDTKIAQTIKRIVTEGAGEQARTREPRLVTALPCRARLALSGALLRASNVTTTDLPHTPLEPTRDPPRAPQLAAAVDQHVQHLLFVHHKKQQAAKEKRRVLKARIRVLEARGRVVPLLFPIPSSPHGPAPRAASLTPTPVRSFHQEEKIALEQELLTESRTPAGEGGLVLATGPSFSYPGEAAVRCCGLALARARAGIAWRPARRGLGPLALP